MSVSRRDFFKRAAGVAVGAGVASKIGLTEMTPTLPPAQAYTPTYYGIRWETSSTLVSYQDFFNQNQSDYSRALEERLFWHQGAEGE